MGEITGISWCDHTFNPWIGCQEISEGCLNCYAARDNARYKWVEEWGKDYRRTSPANWLKPIEWAKQAVKDGITRRVFCASLADVFDSNVPFEWLNYLWTLIAQTAEIGGLEWLILTKRPENISTRIPTMLCGPDSNIRMGVTVENQEMGLRLWKLFSVWSGKNFVSIEPQIEKVELTGFLNGSPECIGYHEETNEFEWRQTHKPVDWVICGSESGPGAHPFDINWARSLRDQCQASGTPFFLKQMPVDGKLVKIPELDGVVYKQFPR